MQVHRFPIGTRFMTRDKHPRECVVIDQLATTNAHGQVVAQRYVATHQFGGQTVIDRDVVDTTIARGLVR